MSIHPLRKGDVVAIRAIVTSDPRPGASVFVEIGYRTLSVLPEEIHNVITRHYDVGEVVMVHTLAQPMKRAAVVQAIVGDWVVCTIEDGMPPIVVSAGDVERCPPQTGEIFKALTTPKIIDGPAPPLEPAPAPPPVEEFYPAAPPSITDTAEAIAAVGGSPAEQF
ncbi:hypothetical protein [uncultured Alsobacter sp.]|uniref:hypothetical protein n=1 Tax=uncultured Alsobacter sp. TaxID=1748258 RepID=UPI0025E24B04|nr:hypothetical protein [uncultured Alsobacter sp.]